MDLSVPLIAEYECLHAHRNKGRLATSTISRWGGWPGRNIASRFSCLFGSTQEEVIRELHGPFEFSLPWGSARVSSLQRGSHVTVPQHSPPPDGGMCMLQSFVSGKGAESGTQKVGLRLTSDKTDLCAPLSVIPSIPKIL